MSDTILYGHNKTIHQTNHLDIEVRDGKVVSVWFRCMALPFKQADVDEARANEMQHAYEGYPPPKIYAIEVEKL